MIGPTFEQLLSQPGVGNVVVVHPLGLFTNRNLPVETQQQSLLIAHRVLSLVGVPPEQRR